MKVFPQNTLGKSFLFVRLHFTFKNFKARQWQNIKIGPGSKFKYAPQIAENFCKSLMQEVSEFFLWHFIIYQLSFDIYLFFLKYFLIFQNQGAAGNVKQLTKKKYLTH